MSGSLLYHADRRHLAALCITAGRRHAALPHAADGAGAGRGGDDAAAGPPKGYTYRHDPLPAGRSTTSSAATRPSCGCSSAAEARSRRRDAAVRDGAGGHAMVATPGRRRLRARRSAPRRAPSTASAGTAGRPQFVHSVARGAPQPRRPCYNPRSPSAQLEERARLAPDEAATFRVQPHNIEAEQALLGAILVNNEAYHRVSELPAPGAFLRAGPRPDLRVLRAADRARPARRPGHAQASCSRRTRRCASSTARAT